jgi:hypothetical protein
MTHPSTEARLSEWSVQLDPPVQGNAAWRSRTLERLRLALLQHLERSPAARQFTLRAPLFAVTLRQESGEWQPGGKLRLRYLDGAAGPPPRTSGTTAADMPDLPTWQLPDIRLDRLGQRLVGLDDIREEVLLRLRLHWAGSTAAQRGPTGSTAAAVLQGLFADGVPLFVFAGDPGVGKSALVQVIADRYCRAAGIEGQLVRLGTDVRASHVGEFGQRLRAAFDQASRISRRTGAAFLLIDEADALAMRRSVDQAHQEDRAGTSTLLQCLDALEPSERLAVFLTTNLAETIDPAVRRRGTSYQFPRPDRRARRRLVARLVPGMPAPVLTGAALLSRGMTPVDIEGAVGQAALSALRGNRPLTGWIVLRTLRRQARTGRV